MDLYMSGQGLETRWSSFENLTAAKGKAAQENKGGKGHAYDHLKAGTTRTLLDVAGSGTIRRIWFTMAPRTPIVLRSLRLDMFWDNSEKPAVSVPFGDFFGHIMGLPPAPFENDLFASPEARSFVCYVPMPFRTGARITLTNESDVDITHLFFDIDFTVGDKHPNGALYFHAHWRRERSTTLGRDFEIMPKVSGEGRFLGCHIGVNRNPAVDSWWGEGEIKMYLDGDDEFPTLAGTGTEDYIGTGWGQGVFANRFQGSLVSDGEKLRYCFYRYHIPDPVYFHKDCRVTMQQIGCSFRGEVVKMVKQEFAVKPVSMGDGESFVFHPLLDLPNEIDLEDPSIPGKCINFYRQDDWSAVAFFYLDSPSNNLPPIGSVESRIEAVE